MFKKILSSIGIGAAKVDAKLENDQVTPGDVISGEIHITGGNVEQSISQIYMNLLTEYIKEDENEDGERVEMKQEEVLASYRVAESLDIQPGEEKTIPFELSVPLYTPASVGKQEVYVGTGLDIKMAVDPGDRDYVTVLPDPVVEQVFQQLEQMGFRHTSDSGKCLCHPRFHQEISFVQEFELKPTDAFRGELDELELIFAVEEAEVKVFMEVDKKARGLFGFLKEAFDMDERYVQFTIDRDEGLAEGVLEEQIRHAING